MEERQEFTLKAKLITWLLDIREAFRTTSPAILVACVVVAMIIMYLLLSVSSDAKQKKALTNTSFSSMLTQPDTMLPDMLVPPTDATGMLVANNTNPQQAMNGVRSNGQVSETGKQSVPNFLPAKLQLFEAHWQGMDTRRLDAELRQKLKYPKGLRGVIVEEVTLNAASGGFLAGDIIVHIAGQRVENLEDFQQGTRATQGETQVSVGILRKTKELDDDGRYRVKAKSIIMHDALPLGFAQTESAPMIMPGDMRPHPHRGPCTSCHNIGTGFELSPDPDLITLPPPVITKNDVRKGIMPHRDRGECMACHVIQ